MNLKRAKKRKEKREEGEANKKDTFCFGSILLRASVLPSHIYKTSK